MSNTSKSSPVIIKMSEWNPSATKYMTPKLNEKGGKSINVISNQTNRSIHLTLPLLMTWGISDFTDDKTGESDGKFSMSLNFPNTEYATTETNLALQKLKDFEEKLLNDAVANSEAWFGKKQSREIVEYGFFPFLKYSKNKETKAIDYTRAPSIRPKVPKYGEDWNIEIYDTKNTRIFPNESSDCVTPMDLIPSKSKVACIIQCSGLWFGGKGWGVTWKLSQCVVKPQEVLSVFGKCHIQLSNDDLQTIENQSTSAEDSGLVEEEQDVPASQPASTEVEDSDTEEAEAEAEPVKVAPAKKIVKKVAPAVEQVAAVEEAPVAAAPKKKIVKKVVGAGA